MGRTQTICQRHGCGINFWGWIWIKVHSLLWILLQTEFWTNKGQILSARVRPKGPHPRRTQMKFVTLPSMLQVYVWPQHFHSRFSIDDIPPQKNNQLPKMFTISSELTVFIDSMIADVNCNRNSARGEVCEKLNLACETHVSIDLPNGLSHVTFGRLSTLSQSQFEVEHLIAIICLAVFSWSMWPLPHVGVSSRQFWHKSVEDENPKVQNPFCHEPATFHCMTRQLISWTTMAAAFLDHFASATCNNEGLHC